MLGLALRFYDSPCSAWHRGGPVLGLALRIVRLHVLGLAQRRPRGRFGTEVSSRLPVHGLAQRRPLANSRCPRGRCPWTLPVGSGVTVCVRTRGHAAGARHVPSSHAYTVSRRLERKPHTERVFRTRLSEMQSGGTPTQLTVERAVNRPGLVWGAKLPPVRLTKSSRTFV